jgi:ribosomal protein S13
LETLIKQYNFEERLKTTNLTEKEIEIVRNAIQFSRDAWTLNDSLPVETRKQISNNFLSMADSTIIAAMGRREKPKRNLIFNFFLSLYNKIF